jgi:hypothetical protein
MDLDDEVTLVASRSSGIRKDRGTAVVAIMHIHK